MAVGLHGRATYEAALYSIYVDGTMGILISVAIIFMGAGMTGTVHLYLKNNIVQGFMDIVATLGQGHMATIMSYLNYHFIRRIGPH